MDGSGPVGEASDINSLELAKSSGTPMFGGSKRATKT